MDIVHNTVTSMHRAPSTHSHLRFKPILLFRSTSMSTCSGVRLALNHDTISPATENTLSAGVEVAVMAKYFSANPASVSRQSTSVLVPPVEWR